MNNITNFKENTVTQEDISTALTKNLLGQPLTDKDKVALEFQKDYMDTMFDLDN